MEISNKLKSLILTCTFLNEKYIEKYLLVYNQIRESDQLKLIKFFEQSEKELQLSNQQFNQKEQSIIHKYDDRMNKNYNKAQRFVLQKSVQKSIK